MKGVQEDGHKFAIMCVKETQGTHLRPGVWLERLVNVKKEMGQPDAWKTIFEKSKTSQYV
jgi:hypothetical protein